MSALQDLVVGMLNAVGGGGVGNLASSLLSTSPEAWNSGLYQTALNIHQTAVKPLTAVVLAVMFSMELARNSSRIQDGGELGVKIVAATMLKMAMVMAIAQNANLILQAFDGVTQFMVGGVSHQLSAGGGGPAGPGVGDQMADQVKDAGMTGQLAVLVMLLIPWVLSQLAAVVATVVMYVRFIEIYALTAFQSLPFALLMHEDTKPIAVGYTNTGTDMTAEAYRLSLGLPVETLADQLGVDVNRVLETVPEEAMAWLEERRAELIDEIHSFMADEQEMRKAGESDPETGGWDFTLYKDAEEFAAANQPTHIADWRTWNQAYLIIGLLMEALGYDITYRRA